MLWLVGLLLAASAARAAAPGPGPAPALSLDAAAAATGRVDAWPLLRALVPADPQADLAAVLAQASGFQVPQVPRANFGVHRRPLWLRLPLHTDGAARNWVLRIDYPPLNQVDVYRVAGDRVIGQHRLGNAQGFAEREVHARSHALRLALPADHHETLYLRVATTSSMLVPVSLLTADAFLADELAQQMLHGLISGVSVALLLYALSQWASLRDPLFACYAVILVGVGVFFASYFGLGQQYLWDRQDGLLEKVAPLAVLMALVGGALFVRDALQARRMNPLLFRLQTAIAVLAALAFAAGISGLLDYRRTQLAATVMGPLPMLLGLPEALRQARNGHHVARWLSLGWLAYTVGALAMAGLLRGWLPSTFWTQHTFQFASLVEMLLWVRVLALRVALVRREAERGVVEREALRSLAHTDALTGLPNRRGLHQALQGALAEVRPDQALAVYLLDLDGFKPVNDRFGHDAGDELLVQVGQRLRQHLRTSDVVARLGGDEFVIMAHGVGTEVDARRLAEKLLQAFEAPFALSGARGCRVGLTIGFALAPQDGLAAEDLLKRADAAMYAGKQAGRHCVRRAGAAPAGPAAAPASAVAGVANAA